ncbi:hypothetical protein [Natrinema pellirubrum]|uniref:hypothetical protein n=1 Tax=Natrinema pellirubrum TaxID=69525 RepID=UPI001268C4D5|nr:hypothetical protein [Natrinema pellirubrum]
MDKKNLFHGSGLIGGGALAVISLLSIANNDSNIVTTLMLIGGVGMFLSSGYRLVGKRSANFDPNPILVWLSVLFAAIGLVGVVLLVLR